MCFDNVKPAKWNWKVVLVLDLVLVLKSKIPYYYLLDTLVHNVKQIGCMLACVCSVTDHGNSQVKSGKNITDTAIASSAIFLFYHILRSSLIFYWTDAWQHAWILSVVKYELETIAFMRVFWKGFCRLVRLVHILVVVHKNKIYSIPRRGARDHIFATFWNIVGHLGYSIDSFDGHRFVVKGSFLFSLVCVDVKVN